MAKMTIKLDSLKPYIDETVHKAVEDVKKNFIEKMRDEITKLQTYKMFPYEGNIYVERDDVLRIFDKYSTGDEENADSN